MARDQYREMGKLRDRPGWLREAGDVRKREKGEVWCDVEMTGMRRGDGCEGERGNK